MYMYNTYMPSYLTVCTNKKNNVFFTSNSVRREWEVEYEKQKKEVVLISRNSPIAPGIKYKYMKYIYIIYVVLRIIYNVTLL